MERSQATRESVRRADIRQVNQGALYKKTGPCETWDQCYTPSLYYEAWKIRTMKVTK